MKSSIYLIFMIGLMIPSMPDIQLLKNNAYPTYSYEIALDIVTDPATAKEATDYIRYSFARYPVFYDEFDEFRFDSDIYMSDVEFYDLSIDNGYIVTKFERTIK